MTLKFPVHIPFVEQLGFELHAVGEGEAELQRRIQTRYGQPSTGAKG